MSYTIELNDVPTQLKTEYMEIAKKEENMEKIDTKNEKLLFGKIVQKAIYDGNITIKDARTMGFATVTEAQIGKEAIRQGAILAGSFASIGAVVGACIGGPVGAVALGVVGGVFGGLAGLVGGVMGPASTGEYLYDKRLDLNF